MREYVIQHHLTNGVMGYRGDDGRQRQFAVNARQGICGLCGMRNCIHQDIMREELASIGAGVKVRRQPADDGEQRAVA